MNIAIPRESHPGETRAAATPGTVSRFVKLGASVQIESGLGLRSGFDDAAYTKAGAVVLESRAQLLGAADLVLRVRKPPMEEISLMRRGTLHPSFLDPFNEPQLIESLASHGIHALSMEMIPRSTRAQKMDALTSQANLAGYMAVIVAAGHLNKILPMMSTAAGTILPSRVFIVGAGVAGLQAIATARRLGAKVEAFDTRPVVAEQVQSLGAKFVQIDLGETGQTAQGYAKELTPEQIAKQQAGMLKCCADSDIVITTAQLFGRKAPLLITDAMLDAMRPGSVVVDLAVESGGNVAGSRVGEVVDRNGVQIVGYPNLAGRLPKDASQVYGMNLAAFVEEFWDKKAGTLPLNLEDDIIQSALITHDGAIWNSRFKKS